jgi:hypothetical protein
LSGRSRPAPRVVVVVIVITLGTAALSAVDAILAPDTTGTVFAAATALLWVIAASVWIGGRRRKRV